MARGGDWEGNRDEIYRERELQDHMTILTTIQPMEQIKSNT